MTIYLISPYSHPLLEVREMRFQAACHAAADMMQRGGHLNLPLETKIELVKKVIGFEQITVGEYVKEHHEYFSQNINHNKNDCCNLDIRFIAPEDSEQESLNI